MWSATSLICFISSSLVDTFAPPITAKYGLSSTFNACERKLFSFSINRPAHAIEACLIAECVEACFLCAVPNASKTYI